MKYLARGRAGRKRRPSTRRKEAVPSNAADKACVPDNNPAATLGAPSSISIRRRTNVGDSTSSGTEQTMLTAQARGPGVSVVEITHLQVGLNAASLPM